MRHSLTPFRALLTCTYLVCAAAAHGAPQPEWPSIALPPSATSHRLGDEVSMVGMPLRMTAFTSPERPAALVEWFGVSIGRPLVLDTVAGKTVLGRREGGFYITLQLEAVGSGTRGWVAVSDIAGFLQKRTQNREAEVRWDGRLPADTQIVSRMHSRDGTRQSDHLVARNSHSEQVNVQALSALLSGHGLVLERDVSPSPLARSPSISEFTATQSKAALQSAAVPFAASSGRTLFYRGRDKEAMAVIARDERGNTSLVVSLITPAEPTR